MSKAVLSLLIITLFLGCGKDDNPVVCTYDACSIVAPESEVAAVETYLANSKIATATKHCSGVYYRIETPGNGTKPTACTDVKVTYTGKLTNENVFDAGTITYNLSDLITGWKNTVPLIGEGGRIHLYIPPSLGYGNRQVGSIPANSILIFEVDLVDVL